ncbi:DNA polymerase III subunit delta' [Curvibacter sp. APW13]|uniref:DNA polymerase III subunit delta' n=1 Tax=Curvibacter sp. APW13 TaxID=3077236 RepID=UPI0028DFF097|nr:DNA polymerase III subunit delta' [Curvibacter sp. APW13]MDT8991639.1 DNA polymerase III subunit delta' [Curvibacter sp. APW13]
MSDNHSEGVLPPWLIAQLERLLPQNGHAWLLHGPSGLGQYELALGLAQAWLCEHPTPVGACHRCSSCHEVEVRTHSDLCVLMPETELLALGWPLSEKAQSEIDDKKRKPSKEIRVEALRDAIEFSQRTSAKGRGKVVLLFPAEMMNHVSANALLKTLEEPPGDTRFVLASRSAHLLLPTIRSRCMTHTMAFPPDAQARQWLIEQGVASQDAGLWLAACGQRPQDALALAREGASTASWLAFPQAMRAGDVTMVREWSAQRLVSTLHKLCHDQMALCIGGAPRFFPASSLVEGCTMARLSSWSKALNTSMRSVEHPYNAGLMQEALVNQARLALHSGRKSAP